MPNLMLRGLLIGFVVSLASGCTIFGGQAADEPQYRVVDGEGDIEIREYDAFTVAHVTVDGPFENAIRQGFMRLFDYISGANRVDMEIEMTAPVLVGVGSDGTDATMPVFILSRDGAPSGSERVSSSAVNREWTTSFVLPAGYREESAPPPDDAGIEIRDLGARRIASISFAGRLRNRTAEIRRQDLARWLAERGLGHMGDWRIAGYNPPWTIPVFRRNEVLVTLR